MHFEFATATRIVFGPGTLAEAGRAARKFGRRAFIVTGRTPSRAQILLDVLAADGVAAIVFSLPGEPTIDSIGSAITQARTAGCDMVVGFGGGSAIDAAKAVAGLLNNPGEPLDYVEVIGRGRILDGPTAPCVAIPTTAGTGAEVTRNAVLTSPARRVKVSLRSQFLLPRLAIVDPELTVGLPPDITAATGLDALTQLIEPFVSSRANALTDGLCVDGIGRAARALPAAFHTAADRRAREDMALASLFGGLALTNAGLGAVHGLAAPIGGRFPAPHGAVCAALLPHVMDRNLRAAERRQHDGITVRRYAEVARLLTGRKGATARDGVFWVRQLVAELGIPGLRSYGLRAEEIPALVRQAAKASSMKANPVPLTSEELSEVLRAAL